MAELVHITHGIAPTYDERSRVLVLGTMPSPASRELGFNYGHPRNRFWRVMAHLAGEPIPSTPARMRDFCLRHHMALWDVLAECDIEGAADASIRNAKPNPLSQITGAAPIEAVFCTGAKAHELYCKLCAADTGIEGVRLPSTSPANAACSFDELAKAYARVFAHEHRFEPPVLDVAAVVELEQTIATAGTPLAELMDRAGTALAWRVEQVLGELKAGTYTAKNIQGIRSDHAAVCILCGNGNNGGDGWVAAAQLASAGCTVYAICNKAPEQLKAQPAKDASMHALQVLLEHGARVLGQGNALNAAGLEGTSVVLVDGTAEQCRLLMERSSVVIDAILGTGASKAPREPFASWIRIANETGSTHVTIAADVASGVSAQTGQAFDPHVHADETVTMIVPKPGLAAPACGVVRVAPLAYIEPYLG